MKKEISETIKSKVHFNIGTGLYELSKYQMDDLTDELEKLFAIPVVVKSVCPLCKVNEPIEGFTVCLSCMEGSVK